MSADLTNLIPPYRKRYLSRDYAYRLGVVAVWLLTILTLIHGLLLIPSYWYAHQQIRTREAQLATLKASSSDATAQDLKTRIDALEKSAKQLAGLGTQATASAAIQGVLAAPRTGIQVHGITYTPSATVDANRMTIMGTAATRESLQRYIEQLDALTYVTKAELPISAYAREKDIPFTITLTGSLKP